MLLSNCFNNRERPWCSLLFIGCGLRFRVALRQRALQRAPFASVEAKQLAGSGDWIVSSASRPGVAYRTDGITCDCEAAILGGDPACLHRAAYWYAVGVLELGPEPEPPASAAPVICFQCRGAEAGCPVCQGAGIASLSAQAVALGAAA